MFINHRIRLVFTGSLRENLKSRPCREGFRERAANPHLLQGRGLRFFRKELTFEAQYRPMDVTWEQCPRISRQKQSKIIFAFLHFKITCYLASSYYHLKLQFYLTLQNFIFVIFRENFVREEGNWGRSLYITGLLCEILPVLPHPSPIML